MTMTVKTPLPPKQMFWFENIQVVSKWYPAPGPGYPRGSTT